MVAAIKQKMQLEPEIVTKPYCGMHKVHRFIGGRVRLILPEAPL